MEIVQVVSVPEAIKNLRKKNNKKMNAKPIFQCDFCEKWLSSELNLIRHQGTVHVAKDFICDFEGKHFNTKDKLRLHILQHRKYFRVSCLVCNREYSTNQSMRKHLR